MTVPATDPAPLPPADGLAGRVRDALDRLAGGRDALGLAVSGGGDSMALLHLAQPWAVARGVRLAVVSIDHRLRAESAQEVQLAAEAAARLGLPHRVLVWSDPPANGNLLQAARQARRRLITDWARAEGIGAVALGHTRDDLAETLLMRLARGAGLTGLAAMAERHEAAGLTWLRPLLDCGRGELRAWLRANAIPWADDPSNDDPRFERARMRAAIAGLGLDPARIARSARNLAQAQDALIPGVLALTEGARAEDCTLWLPLPRLLAASAELRRRLLVTALAWLHPGEHAPRQAALDGLLAALRAGRRTTLAGCILTPGDGMLHLAREPAAAARAAPLRGAGIWDARFALPAPPAGCHVAAGPGSARPHLWQGAHPLGPAPGARPLRDLGALRAMISAPRCVETAPEAAETAPQDTKPH